MSPLNPPPLSAPPRSTLHQGRFGRLSYIAWQMVLWWAGLCIGFGLLVSLGIFNLATFSFESSDYVLPTINYTINVLFLLVYTYFSFVITIRRLHDLNLSGWWSLLSYVPLLNIFFFLYLLFKRGHSGSNRYAPVRPTPIWEKLVAWLGIIFSVIVLLSFILLISSINGSIEFFPTDIWSEKASDFF
jgi:uncharacterized membrane protein YhaH (DUF805 family)